jgi:hypothetical protein
VFFLPVLRHFPELVEDLGTSEDNIVGRCDRISRYQRLRRSAFFLNIFPTSSSAIEVDLTKKDSSFTCLLPDETSS